MTKTYKIIEDRINYNSQDFGEMGKFIRVEYALNILKEALSDKEEKKCNHIWSKSHIEPMFATCINCGKDRWLDKEEPKQEECHCIFHATGDYIQKEPCYYPKQSTSLKDVSCKCCKNCI